MSRWIILWIWDVFVCCFDFIFWSSCSMWRNSYQHTIYKVFSLFDALSIPENMNENAIVAHIILETRKREISSSRAKSYYRMQENPCKYFPQSIDSFNCIWEHCWTTGFAISYTYIYIYLAHTATSVRLINYAVLISCWVRINTKSHSNETGEPVQRNKTKRSSCNLFSMCAQFFFLLLSFLVLLSVDRFHVSGVSLSERAVSKFHAVIHVDWMKQDLPVDMHSTSPYQSTKHFQTMLIDDLCHKSAVQFHI